MRVCTIGFTHKTAEEFFSRLKSAGVKRMIDVRLHNVSQLAGFSKRDDLKFFLKAILRIEYVHLPILAPTEGIREEYAKSKDGWEVYRRKFGELMRRRRIEDQVAKELIDGACLLCSEDQPHFCHRRLVAEYLKGKWGKFEVEHI